MRHYLVNCANEDERKDYAETLETKAVSELICGEKASAPINVQIAGIIVMNIVNFISEKDYTKVLIANASTPKQAIIVLKLRPKIEVKLEEPIQVL
jgi:hypothetical protein